MDIALIAPEIPPNTGNIARLCAAMQTPLHLVRPLGFLLDDRHLRRAGLDYWPHVDLRLHESLEAFFAVCPAARCYFVSTRGRHPYTDVCYRPTDALVFGNESSGLPRELLAAHADRTITIPMSGPVRSLNLSTAVAIVLGEALRQQKFSSV